MLLAARGEHESARVLLEDAVDRFERRGGVYNAARARVELATTLAELGRSESAASEAAVAETALHGLGALPEAARAARLRDLCAPWRDAEALPVTPRERELLCLLAAGLTNRQIAEQLVVSEHTVHRHVTNLLRKLGLPSRTAARSPCRPSWARGPTRGIARSGYTGAIARWPGLAKPAPPWAPTVRAMRHLPAPMRRIAQAAALARIDEMIRRADRPEGRSTMTANEMATTSEDRAVKAATRAMWASGDYHRFATSTVWELGPILVEACSVKPGQRILDVAAGTGNVAIRAAEPERASSLPTSRQRTSTQAGTKRPGAASSSTGSRPTRRRCPSPTGSSTS
jgi:DNA-binding CsgD family transcriptional regulator